MQAADFDESSIPRTERQLKPAASFSPDGKLLLLASGSKSAQLRDGFSGDLVREFAHKDLVYHAAFSVDGRYVVTSSKDNTARVWDVLTGKPAAPPLQHSGWVAWAQFSSDGNKLLTVRERHHVQLWDWREGRRVAPELQRRSVLWHASLSPDGTNVLTAARSGYAQLYDATSSRFMYQFYQHGGIVDAAFSPDGGYIATACEDGNAWIFFDTSTPPVVLPQGNDIEDIDFSGDGRRLAVAGRGGHTRVWELFPAERGLRLPGNNVQWVEFDASGRRAIVLSTGDKSGVAVYEAQTGKCLSFIALKLNRPIFNCSGNRVLALSNRAALVFDADTGHQLFSLSHEQPLQDAAWSPDGKFIITAAGRAGAQAWDADTGKLAITFPVSNSINTIAISPDGKRVALGNEKKTIQVWEFASSPRIVRSIMLNERIKDLKFSPDGQSLAISTYAAGGGGIIELRNVASGEPLGRPLLHRDNVTSFQFSRNGRWLATSCDDHTARVWGAATGEPVTGWLPHAFEALQVTFSPDGTRLATRERRGAIRLWNTLTGEPLTAPLLYPRNTGDGWISYSPDGQRLLLCRGANEACLRDLRPESATIQELKLLAQVLSCTRFDPAAGMVPLNESELTASWNQLRASRFRH